MNFSIENLESETIYYMRRTGTYGTENYAFMNSFKSLMKKHHLFSEKTVIYGIALDDPTVTFSKHCRYDIGTTTEIFDRDVCIRQIDGGKYAVFLIDHTAQMVQYFWNQFPKHLRDNSLEIDSKRPIIERYAQEVLSKNFCQMMVPII